MSWTRFFCLFVVLCPIAYVKFYLFLTEDTECEIEPEVHQSEKYDTYYVLHGRTQNPKPTHKCEPCSEISASNSISTSCIYKYECALQLGLEASLRWFHIYNNQDFADLGGPNEGTANSDSSNINDYSLFNRDSNIDKSSTNNNNIFPQSSLLSQSISSSSSSSSASANRFGGPAPLQIDLDSDVIGVSTASDGKLDGYDYLVGKWVLQSKQHNGNNVYHLNDKFRRNLKMFVFGRTGKERRWLVGNDVNNDGAFAYAPMDPSSPVEVGHAWLHFDNAAKSWLPLKHFRLTPVESVKPLIQQVVPRHRAKNVRIGQKIQMMFTHKIESTGIGFLELCYKNLDEVLAPEDSVPSAGSSDKSAFDKDPFLYYLNETIATQCFRLTFVDSPNILSIEGDVLKIDLKHLIRSQSDANSPSQTLKLTNSIIFISLSRDLVRPIPSSSNTNTKNNNVNSDNVMNGNMECINCLMFATTCSNLDWNEVASQYLDRAYELALEAHEKKASKETKDDVIEALLLNALLYNDDEDSLSQFIKYSQDRNSRNDNDNEYGRDKAPFIHYFELLSDAMKMFDERRDEDENKWYLNRLAETNLIDGYMKLFSNPKLAVKEIDNALKNCIKHHSNTTASAKDLKNAGEIYCDFHAYDTYYRLPQGYHANSLPNHFNSHYFPLAIRLKWFVNSYMRHFSNNLSILFENSNRYQYDINSLAIDSDAVEPHRFDILLGSRKDQIRLARTKFAQLGAVQLRNLLSPIECNFLSKYFSDAIRREYPKSIADYDSGLVRSVFNSDRVSFVFLTELNAIMNDLVGRPVKKAYSFFCGYSAIANHHRKPWLLSHTDREDNEYTFSLTLRHDGPLTPVFPIYAHTAKSVARRKNYRFLDSNETIEFLNDVGDAVLFKGRQHIHYRRDMPSGLKNYWTILFHYNPIEFDMQNFKTRSQSNRDI